MLIVQKYGGTSLGSRERIEGAARRMTELARQGLTESRENFLEPHALEITRRIQSQELRSMHIMEG